MGKRPSPRGSGHWVSHPVRGWSPAAPPAELRAPFGGGAPCSHFGSGRHAGKLKSYLGARRERPVGGRPGQGGGCRFDSGNPCRLGWHPGPALLGRGRPQGHQFARGPATSRNIPTQPARRIPIYLYTCIPVYLYLYVHTCTYMYIYVHMCTYMYIYVRITHICTYMYIYVHICTCM